MVVPTRKEVQPNTYNLRQLQLFACPKDRRSSPLGPLFELVTEQKKVLWSTSVCSPKSSLLSTGLVWKDVGRRRKSRGAHVAMSGEALLAPATTRHWMCSRFAGIVLRVLGMVHLYTLVLYHDSRGRCCLTTVTKCTWLMGLVSLWLNNFRRVVLKTCRETAGGQLGLLSLSLEAGNVLMSLQPVPKSEIFGQRSVLCAESVF